MEEAIVLKNVTEVINQQEVDIVISGGKIKEITKPNTAHGDKILDCSGVYVSSGWIDLHVHAFPEFSPYGDDIDEIGVKQGVTTIVDAGSCGADRIGDLFLNSQKSKTNVYAFLNISRIGLKRIDELSNLEWIDRQEILQAIDTYKDNIVGLKARISKSVVGENGLQPLRIARGLSKETNLPVMVHIGSGPPDITEIIPLLKERDIITHYLNGKKNNLFDEHGRPLQVLTEATKRGIHLDVGHGTASFSFQVAENAKEHNVPIGTISTDIYRGNRLNGPVYSLANVLSKFLYLGYSLQEVIKAVTINPANWLGNPGHGRINIGEVANLTLFSVRNKSTKLVDSEGDERVANKIIEVKGVVVNGEFIEC